MLPKSHMITPWQHFRKFESLKLTMGEALIDLVCQYPGLWDKSDPQYKDQNYKVAKWKEIVTILEILGKYAFMITCMQLLMIFLQALLKSTIFDNFHAYFRTADCS